jgi:hypothetical protein
LQWYYLFIKHLLELLSTKDIDMSRSYDDLSDEDFAVSSEMLEVLATKDSEGMTSTDLLASSQLAANQVDVSRALGGLRRRGSVISTINPDNVRVFIITSQGMAEINDQIVEAQVSLSDVSPHLTQGRFKSSGSSLGEPTVTLVSTKRYSGLKCMLSSEGIFVLDVPGDAKFPAQHIELNSEQTKHLFLYMGRLFPGIVTLQASEID